MSLRLLVETPASEEQFEYIEEQKNIKGQSVMKIRGPYMACEEVNKNRRIYTESDMEREVNRYVQEMVVPKRALGELNHPASAEVDLERACHMVTSLRKDGNIIIGESIVLSTPVGQIVRSLINDGVKVGMSSRALGQLEEQSDGINRVNEMRLIAIDCVADPSCPKAFVNGILESKQYVLNMDGKLEEVYESFEKTLRGLPRHDVASFLKEQIMSFLSKL
jgi:Prohead core protein serine protease